MSSIPACVQCGTQLRWFVEQKTWGCDRCQKLFVIPGTVPPPMQNPWVATPQRRTNWLLIIGILVVVGGGVTAAIVLTRGGGGTVAASTDPGSGSGSAGSGSADSGSSKPASGSGSSAVAAGSGSATKPAAGSGSAGSGSATIAVGSGSGSAGSGSGRQPTIAVGSGSAAAGSGSGSAGKGSATPVAELPMPSSCKDYKAALEKLVVCTKLPAKSHDGLKAALDEANGWKPPTTADASKELAATCKKALGSIKKSRAICQPRSSGPSF